MHRRLVALLLLLAALVASLADGSPAQAKHRHWRLRVYKELSEPPAPPFPVYQVPANRPRWLPWHQCYTDDGHGRYLPCDLGAGGGS